MAVAKERFADSKTGGPNDRSTANTTAAIEQ